MRDATVLSRIKLGERIPKPALKVKTIIPDGWNPTDVKSYAEAFKQWRNR